MKQQIQNLLTQLNHGLVERENTIKAALLAVLAGENIVLIGPPGTGKSMIARRIAESLAPTDNTPAYFEYLLTKFSTPEEIFGPLSITELKADRLKRNTASYLPTVRFAFLDEIFKASSSILNALLTILNERIYHNGAEAQQVPLQSLIAASNELPSDQEELSALYDRFLLRVFVDYVSPNNLGQLFERPGKMPALAQLGSADLARISDAAETIAIPAEIVEAIQRIWIEFKESFKDDRREILSDRRLKKIIKLICVSAASNGRQEVDLSDVFLLKDCLWNHPDNALKVRDLIMSILRNYSHQIPVASSNPDTAREAATAGPSIVSEQRHRVTGQLNALIKGYKGSGTENDPILIENVHDLVGLERPAVGQQGYYFRQTADIDCSELSLWPAINFRGSYDGQKHSIKHKGTKRKNFSQDEKSNCLFAQILDGSNISALMLDEMALAEISESSHISTCTTNTYLIEKTASNCAFTQCESTGSLISHDANNCTVSQCFSSTSIVAGNAAHSTISECEIILDISGPNENTAGIALALTEDSVVERCYVAGEIRAKRTSSSGVWGRPSEYKFSGIAQTCDSSTIRCCALGKLKLGKQINLSDRIARPINENWILENNVSISSNQAMNIRQNLERQIKALTNVSFDDTQGKTVDEVIFSQQRYFEHTLGWDFDHTWQWDDKDARPVLRSFGVNAITKQMPSPEQDNSEMTDLLTQQIRANIWL